MYCDLVGLSPGGGHFLPLSALRKIPPGVRRSLGAFLVDTVHGKVIEGEDDWDCLSRLVQGILRRKED